MLAEIVICDTCGREHRISQGSYLMEFLRESGWQESPYSKNEFCCKVCAEKGKQKWIKKEDKCQ